MAKRQKSSMHEGQNKIARLMRLDQLLRKSDGLTLKEIMDDEQMDQISKRLLQSNLKEIAEKYSAEFADNMYRGRQRLWRYKDTNFSIMRQTSADMEIIRKTIDDLSLFKGDPRYDMLRFYLIGLEKGICNSDVSFMSFDNNNDAAGLEHVEDILNAITHQFPIKMLYKPFGKNELVFDVHPYHLRQYNRRWFVFGYVEQKKEILNFALDRIISISHLSKPYIKSTVDFEEYFDDVVGVTNFSGSDVETILLKISNDSIDYIRTKPLHWTQTELKSLNSDEYTYVQLKVKVNIELIMLLFSYNDAIEVLEPASLRDIFVRKLKNMDNLYKV